MDSHPISLYSDVKAANVKWVRYPYIPSGKKTIFKTLPEMEKRSSLQEGLRTFLAAITAGWWYSASTEGSDQPMLGG